MQWKYIYHHIPVLRNAEYDTTVPKKYINNENQTKYTQNNIIVFNNLLVFKEAFLKVEDNTRLCQKVNNSNSNSVVTQEEASH